MGVARGWAGPPGSTPPPSPLPAGFLPAPRSAGRLGPLGFPFRRDFVKVQSGVAWGDVRDRENEGARWSPENVGPFTDSQGRLGDFPSCGTRLRHPPARSQVLGRHEGAPELQTGTASEATSRGPAASQPTPASAPKPVPRREKPRTLSSWGSTGSPTDGVRERPEQ